jgi:ATP-dependent phosphofructokinase / diphosphate-dependent phosphofructokinase
LAVKRIGVLTNGGDCPGLNAAIRAVVKTATDELGLEVIGIRDGYSGLIEADKATPLGPAEVQGLLPRGGTFLGTSRADPLHYPDAHGAAADRSDDALRTAERLGLDALIAIGGDGSLSAARDLGERGLPVIGIPKTIDNDVCCTDASIGFDTAVATAMEAIDRLHTTAESHHRVMVLEVMGRHAGWIALAAGVAGGADVILIPELPYHLEPVVTKIERRISQGRLFSILVVAEGALAAGEGLLSKTSHVGGMGERVACELGQRMGREIRCTVLGHIQRGGEPSAADRLLATRFGAAAVRFARQGRFRQMTALHAGDIVPISLDDAVAQLNLVPVEGDLVQAAQSSGACLGTLDA